MIVQFFKQGTITFSRGDMVDDGRGSTTSVTSWVVVKKFGSVLVPFSIIHILPGFLSVKLTAYSAGCSFKLRWLFHFHSLEVNGGAGGDRTRVHKSFRNAVYRFIFEHRSIPKVYFHVLGAIWLSPSHPPPKQLYEVERIIPLLSCPANRPLLSLFKLPFA